MPDHRHAGDVDPYPGQNHYAVLGVPRDASTADIVRAFRVLARGYHPDLHPGDPQAADRFRRLAAAYQVLTDPPRRAAYDRAHPAPAPRPPQRSSPPPQPSRVTVKAATPPPDPPLRAGPVYHTPATRRGRGPR